MIKFFEMTKHRGLPRFALLLLMSLLPAFVHSAETGIAARDLELLAEPRGDARVVGRIAKDTRFEQLSSDKSWARISAGNQQGWVQMFFLSWGAAPAANPNPGRVLQESLGLATQQQQRGVTATLGARGIDEEQLKSARFDAEELKRLEALLVPGPVADRFAQEGRLQPRKLNYIAAPSSGTSNPRRAGAP